VAEHHRAEEAAPGADEAAKEDNKIAALTLEGGS